MKKGLLKILALSLLTALFLLSAVGCGGGGGGVDGDEFVNVSLSSDGVLSWTKLNRAKNYQIQNGKFGTGAQSETTTETSFDLKTFNLSDGRHDMTLLANEEEELFGEKVDVEFAVYEFTVVKTGSKYELLNLKYSDNNITLNGFESELVNGKVTIYVQPSSWPINIIGESFNLKSKIKIAGTNLWSLYSDSSFNTEIPTQMLMGLKQGHNYSYIKVTDQNGTFLSSYEIDVYILGKTEISLTDTSGNKIWSTEIWERESLPSSELFANITQGQYIINGLDILVNDGSPILAESGMTLKVINQSEYDELQQFSENYKYTYSYGRVILNEYIGSQLSYVRIPDQVLGYPVTSISTEVSYFFPYDIAGAFIPSFVELSLSNYLAQNIIYVYTDAQTLPSSWESLNPDKVMLNISPDNIKISQNYIYVIENEGATITSFISDNQTGVQKFLDIVIPEDLDGYPVKKIAPYGIYPMQYSNISIESVTLPSSLEVLSANSIDSNQKILSLPSSLNTVEQGAFNLMYSLRIVEIAPSLSSITVNYGSILFYTSAVEMPSGWDLGYNELILNYPSNKLSTNGIYYMTDDMIYYKDYNSYGIYMYLGEQTEINLPSTLNIDSVQYDVDFVHNEAFTATAIQSVTFPGTPYIINNNAFSFCSDLTEVDLKGVTSIGDSAFYYCTSLNNVVVPATVTEIGSAAFNSCSSLSDLTFESGSQIQSIGSTAFGGTALTYLQIPDTVKNINKNIVDDLSILDTEIEGGVIYLGSIAIAAADFNIKEIVIREGTTIIADNAFDNLENIKKISLPSTLLSIGSHSFDSYTEQLDYIVIPDSVESMGINPFPYSENLAIYTNSPNSSNWGSSWIPSSGKVYTQGMWEFVNGVPRPL